MKKKITLILFLVTVLFFLTTQVYAKKERNLVNIYFFHSNSCAHCVEEKKLLNVLEKRYDNVKIYRYEIHEKENNKILEKARGLYSIKTKGVPITIIGDKVYEGFSHELSNLKFIKTIEYYSRYGYVDKLGTYLNLTLPNYDIDNNNVSLETFIDNYHNYKILGLTTDDLGYNDIAILLGLLSIFDVIFIIGIILILFIIKKLEIKNNCFIILSSYLLGKNLILLVNLINNRIVLVSIYLLLLSIFIFNIIKYRKQKSLLYILFNIIILISLFISSINLNFSKNISIFNSILNLYGLNGLNKMAYFSNYFLMNISLSAILIYLFTLIFENYFNKVAIKEEKNK